MQRADLFPYEYRPGQRELVRFISNTVDDGMSPVVEAGTGTGKTVSALAATLPTVLERGMKVIYLTRTKSQQKQVIREAAAIGHGILCVGLQGRTAASCPMMRDDPDLASGTSEEISKLCSEYKRRDAGECRCRFYANIEHTDIDSWVERIREEHPEPEGFARMCEEAELCPYEMLKYALPHADVIAASYPFVFMPQILARLVDWIGIPLHRTVIVVDEAHNLPDYLRDVQTFEYSRAALDLAEKEARENGDSEVHEGLTVTDIVGVLREVLGYAVKEYLIDDDGILPPYFLEDELMSRLGMTSVSIMRIVQALEDIGDSVAERKKQRRKLPRSYIGSMGRFMRAWLTGSEDCHVRLVLGGDNPCFQSYCMDPSGASDPLNECFASVHMSGTLEPIDAYIRDIGLDRAVPTTLNGFFPRENLLTLYSDEVSMRYEDRFIESNYARLRQLLYDTVNSVRVNTAVFFPSYQFMDRMLDDGVASDLGRDIYYERRDMPQEELMEVFDSFRTSEGSVLFCVTGGRISEGLDFPDKSLELAVLIGIPYPKPTAKMRAMTRYYDAKFGDGRLYVSIIPASRKMRQSIGRLIRSETDRGVAVILDRRAASLRDISPMLCGDIPAAVTSFFSQDR
ncbi:ATP-dependent DNA helicase [Methanomassiliicoccaceae archaeon DOK]|nr:ATP-dependent DNA helicase [Methanomassiliicoccaceae archaeon DOK]